MLVEFVLPYKESLGFSFGFGNVLRPILYPVYQLLDHKHLSPIPFSFSFLFPHHEFPADEARTWDGRWCFLKPMLLRDSIAPLLHLYHHHLSAAPVSWPSKISRPIKWYVVKKLKLECTRPCKQTMLVSSVASAASLLKNLLRKSFALIC